MKLDDTEFKHEFKVVPFNMLPCERFSTGDLKKDERRLEEEKTFIRDKILGKSNETILNDAEALQKLCHLGSDLVINCFAVNFKIDGNWNTDVEAANRLNKRIVKRMSSVYPKHDPTKIEFFLTSTEFHENVYGECAQNFKKRLGLQGKTDLFVLRNVVMSPFPTAGSFIKQLAKTFGKIVDEEIANCLPVSDPNFAKKHRFVAQGYARELRTGDSEQAVYLAYMPSFYKANSASQLILRATLGAEYHEERRKHPETTFCLETTEELLFSNIKTSFTAKMCESGAATPSDATTITVDKIEIIKERSLRAADRDDDYPDFMHFYLYGSTEPGDQHISHILQKAPNIMICAENVTVTLDDGGPLTKIGDFLQKGCIARTTTVRERLCQPCADYSHFFGPGREISIEILTDSSTKKPIAKGNLVPHPTISKRLKNTG
jgi:hypothetical protein